MMNIQKIVRSLNRAGVTRMSTGQYGDGAGKGGGGGGSIREAGGSFGRMEAAREEEFFYKQQQAQLKKLKEQAIDQKTFHEEQLKLHKEALERHEKHLAELKK
ncbi:ATPase inhibitor mai-2, mitochondrial-like [Ctenocephalides felis]|uniref:ATPase inhibitor mai-2, mitochondrial-like n=1 Tax=Ctenocephalides felis TaxID=7515 RepID=UPI000E6E2D00|nr:ATPase inhibitor mai-2, mitochondrial-like [Ctenocephalides felis]